LKVDTWSKAPEILSEETTWEKYELFTTQESNKCRFIVEDRAIILNESVTGQEWVEIDLAEDIVTWTQIVGTVKQQCPLRLPKDWTLADAPEDSLSLLNDEPMDFLRLNLGELQGGAVEAELFTSAQDGTLKVHCLFRWNKHPLTLPGNQKLVDVTRVAHALLSETHNFHAESFKGIWFANRGYNHHVGSWSDVCTLNIDTQQFTADWTVKYDV
jgi:hypothetical protein